jgi:hypothetical protein
MCNPNSGGVQVSTSTTQPWEQQIPYLTGGFEAAKEIYNRGAPAYYPGETLAGFDPAQKQAQEGTLNYIYGKRAGGMQSGAEESLMRNLRGEASGFTGGQMSDLLAGNVRTGEGTPYQAMASALTGDVVGNLQKNILPGIRQQQVMYQPGGSSRAALQQNRAVTDAVQAGLTKPLAQMYTDAYTQAQGMRLPAAQQMIGQQQFGLQQYPSTMMAPIGLFGQAANIGAQRRAMTQAAIDRDMARYEYEANAPQNALRNYMAMVTGDYGSSTTQTTPYQGQGFLGTVGQIAGTLGSLATAGVPMPWSDTRLKENITYLGKDKGYNIYSWDWNSKAKELGINTPTIGVLAQEVKEINPDAVVLDKSGYYKVNYGAL